MTLRLILSGTPDIPGNKQKSPTCSTCSKTAHGNSSITHLKCITSYI